MVPLLVNLLQSQGENLFPLFTLLSDSSTHENDSASRYLDNTYPGRKIMGENALEQA